MWSHNYYYVFVTINGMHQARHDYRIYVHSKGPDQHAHLKAYLSAGLSARVLMPIFVRRVTNVKNLN